jgi:Rap1a immunity proteins
VLSHLICPRSNPSGLTAQAVAVALRSLNDHPEKWDQPPAFLIGESFKAAFPCGG